MGFGSLDVRSYAAVACATAVMATFVLVLQADARTRKDERHVVRERSFEKVERSAQPLSLDGRNTGRSRTCGSETFQYDNRGVPYGPYCH
jgi:hypothetical protein